MLLKEITSYLENIAPLSMQESYDNSGLQTGEVNMEIKGVLITIDITEEVVEEAVQTGHNLILAHHPLIFEGIKSVTGRNSVERILREAIKHDIAIYAGHTNFDAIVNGVNRYMSDRIGLVNTKILSPASNLLRKLVVFVPVDYAGAVREAMFAAGAGHIGEYDSCSFNMEGRGTFRGSETTNPFVGEKGELHVEPEVRVETVLPASLENKVVAAMIKAHPYEEVAYDIYPLMNEYERVGMGMIGDLENPVEETEFLELVKKKFDTGCIRHTGLLGRKIKKVAICGGSGSFLLRKAISSGADAFITGDFKYHQFFEADNKIIILDIGHYESEQYTRELFYDLLIKKFPKFAVRLSEINTNPIKYF